MLQPKRVRVHCKAVGISCVSVLCHSICLGSSANLRHTTLPTMDAQAIATFMQHLETTQKTFVEQLQKERQESTKRADDDRRDFFAQLSELRNARAGYRMLPEVPSVPESTTPAHLPDVDDRPCFSFLDSGGCLDPNLRVEDYAATGTLKPSTIFSEQQLADECKRIAGSTTLPKTLQQPFHLSDRAIQREIPGSCYLFSIFRDDDQRYRPIGRFAPLTEIFHTADNSTNFSSVGHLIDSRIPDPATFLSLSLLLEPQIGVWRVFEHLSDPARPSRSFSQDSAGEIGWRPSHVVNCFAVSFKFLSRKPMFPEWKAWYLRHTEANKAISSINLACCDASCGLEPNSSALAVWIDSSPQHPGPVHHTKGEFAEVFGPWYVLSIHSSTPICETPRSLIRPVSGAEAFVGLLVCHLRNALGHLSGSRSSILKCVKEELDFDTDESLAELIDYYTHNLPMLKSAFESMARIIGDIEDILKTCAETFNSDFWACKPGSLFGRTQVLQASARFDYFRSKLTEHRTEFAKIMSELESLRQYTIHSQQQLEQLREQMRDRGMLWAIKHSRTTADQGRNVRMLTYISILYLPLSLATAIFGMTNVPANLSFMPFATTIVCLSISTYLTVTVLASRPEWAVAFMRRLKSFSRQLQVLIPLQIFKQGIRILLRRARQAIRQRWRKPSDQQTRSYSGATTEQTRQPGGRREEPGPSGDILYMPGRVPAPY